MSNQIHGQYWERHLPNAQNILLSSIILAWLLFSMPQCIAAEEPSLTAEHVTTKSGNQYVVFHPHNCKLDFALSRPDKQDENILLCIPAAFTSKSGGLCGLYSSHGEVKNQGLIDKKIGGAILLENGSAKIFDTARGASLNTAFTEQLKTNKSSFFQQFQIIKDKQAETFKDKTRCQRRCISTMTNGELFVIESADAETFQEFGEDLVELGAENAIYTDMGPYGGGWYRSAKRDKVVLIGKSQLMTSHQTNWFVIEKTMNR